MYQGKKLAIAPRRVRFCTEKRRAVFEKGNSWLGDLKKILPFEKRENPSATLKEPASTPERGVEGEKKTPS